MSLPYLPGWGDTLAQHLPKIGQDIAHITNPYREQEEMFTKLIATKPELMDEYAQREQDSPGALKGVFGKKVSDFVRQQPISEQYTVARARERVALKAGELGTKAQEVGIDKELLDLAENKRLAAFRQNNPLVQDMHTYLKLTGKSSFEDLRHTLKKDEEMMTRYDLAEPYKGQSGVKLARDYKDGLVSTEAMQGIIENNPGAMTAAFAILDDETRGKLQRDLHKMSADREDAWLMKQKVAAVIRGAREAGIDNPNAYAKIVFGEELPGLPEVTEDDDKQAGDRFAAADAARDLKSSENQRKADQAVFDKIRTDMALIGKGSGISDENRAILEGGVNANLARLGKTYGYKAAAIPKFERIKGGFDSWTLGGKKIGANEMATFMNELTGKIIGVEEDEEEEPPAAASDTTGARPPVDTLGAIMIGPDGKPILGPDGKPRRARYGAIR